MEGIQKSLERSIEWEIVMDLAQIEKLAKADRYEEALYACESLLRAGSVEVVEVLRARAYVFARSGDYARASDDREEVLNTGKATIADHYQAADQALKAGNVNLASRRFKEVLILGEEQGEGWFASAALFYLAYIEMERGNFEGALEHVDLVKASSPDCAMPLPDSGMVSLEDLENEIRHRRK